jgi:hypothetical protein
LSLEHWEAYYRTGVLATCPTTPEGGYDQEVRDGQQRLAGIEFHAGIATERLPFESSSFDPVSGQYALEHMRIDAALAEIFRVLERVPQRPPAINWSAGACRWVATEPAACS